MKKAFSAQNSSGGLALSIIAAAVVTWPGSLWPDLSCVELLPLPSGVLSAPPGTLGVRCGMWCLKLGYKRELKEKKRVNKFRSTCKGKEMFLVITKKAIIIIIPFFVQITGFGLPSKLHFKCSGALWRSV